LRISFAIVIAVGALFGEPAEGQTQVLEAAGPSDSARYTFYRMGDNFLRFDVQTGQVADCGWTASGWFRRMAPDERTALEAEIARLYEINIALKKSLLAHSVPLPDGINAPPIPGVSTTDCDGQTPPMSTG
jgi:hypothetical protein